jgi:hypothetical protein
MLYKFSKVGYFLVIYRKSFPCKRESLGWKRKTNIISSFDEKPILHFGAAQYKFEGDVFFEGDGFETSFPCKRESFKLKQKTPSHAVGDRFTS